MKPVRNALAALAAAGLVLAPVAAQAAPQRSASRAGQSEKFVGSWVIFALLLGALVPVAIIFASDSKNTPASP